MQRWTTYMGAALLIVGASLQLATGQTATEPSKPNESPPAPAPSKPNESPPAPAPEPPGPMPVTAELPSPARFVVVELHEEVSLGMAAFVERVADDLGAGDILVLDINTFGGRVDAAVGIRDTLLELDQRSVRTIAYIHPRAISAGALISLATDIIVVSPGATIGAATPVKIGEGGKMEATDEKAVSYMRQEMRATAEARGRSGDIAEAMVDADFAVPGVSAKGKLLTLDGKQALAWRIASFEAATLDLAIAELGYTDAETFTVTRVQWSWAEKTAAFLTGSMLSGLLMSIGMLGLMIGLYTGGSPIPLTVGGVCLGVFFFGHHIVNLAGVEEIVLFLLGAGLIFYEIIAPGHIIPGVLGVLLVIASLAMGLVNFEQVPFEVQWEQGWVMRALGTVFGAIAGAAVMTIAAFQVLPGTQFGRRLLLEAAIDGRATDKVDRDNQGVVGRIGVAESDLRPSGKVKVDGRRYDAVAERGFVPAGAEIEVLRLRGFSVVVAEVRNREAS